MTQLDLQQRLENLETERDALQRQVDELQEQVPVCYIHQTMLDQVSDGSRTCGRVWANSLDEISNESRVPLFIQPVPIAVEIANLRQHSAIGYSKERCEQTGDSPFDAIDDLRQSTNQKVKDTNSDGEKIYQVYLVGYSHIGGFGRTFNYRDDNQPPSFQDIESMETKISENNGLSGVCITSISRIRDSEPPVV